jgi:SAM-dependent methyltransferase
MLSIERQNELRDAFRVANPGWQPATEVYAGLVRANLREDSRVLDLGCGRGGLVEQLGHPVDLVVGLDPDLDSLRDHRLVTAGLPRVAGHSRAMPFAERSLDLIFASWVLEHLPEPALDFRQIGRLLKPGGAFIFITPNKNHPLTALNRLLGRLGRLQDRLVESAYGRAAADTFPTYYRANSPADLARLAARADLSVTELHTISDPTYLAFNPLLFRLGRWLDGRLAADRYIHLVGLLRV